MYLLTGSAPTTSSTDVASTTVTSIDVQPSTNADMGDNRGTYVCMLMTWKVLESKVWCAIYLHIQYVS